MNKIKYCWPNSLNKKKPFRFIQTYNITIQYNISTIHVVSKTLKSIIKLVKDSTNKWEQTNTVYKFNCINSESVICEHRLEFKYEFDWKNTRIVDYVSDYRKRLTSEMIHIKLNKFSINNKEEIFTLNIFFLFQYLIL